MSRIVSIAATAGLALASTAGASITDFESGLNGWSVSGRTDISATGGNPGANLDNVLIDVFGAEIRNSTNDDLLGDYSRFSGGVQFTVDVKINSLDFFGTQVSRELGVFLRSSSADDGFFDRGVYFPLGIISQAESMADEDGWITYTTILNNTTQTDLPAGWIGTGDEDPMTFEPILPAGVTFADVLADVDQLEFTTFTPGFFFGFTNFDIQVDNVGIIPVPAPGAVALLGCGALAATRRRR